MLEFIKRVLPIGFITFVIILAAYSFIVRPWIFRMGSTNAELNATMPGDDKVVDAAAHYTQAITISAPKDIVWSYLIQVGHKRGGWYNLDFINRLADKSYFYENDKSADRIIPELQNLKQGDKISIAPVITFDVEELSVNDHMLLTGKENGKYSATWCYLVKEIGKEKTRLIVRWNKIADKGLLLKLFDYFIIDFGGSGIQQRLTMRGIKSRAEAAYQARK